MVLSMGTHKGRRQRHDSMEVAVSQPEVATAPDSSDEIPSLAEWRGRSEFVLEHTKGDKRIRKYLRQESIQFFLSHVSEGSPFDFRGLGTSEDFAYPEFLTIMGWLKMRNLAKKGPGGYVIDSIEAVRRAWNMEMSKAVQI